MIAECMSVLHEFFGANFHQDWIVEHDTAEQVIDYFATHSAPEDLSLVCKEIGLLLALGKSETELRAYLLKELSCYYCYWNKGKSGEEWLRHIASKLKVV